MNMDSNPIEAGLGMFVKAKKVNKALLVQFRSILQVDMYLNFFLSNLTVIFECLSSYGFMGHHQQNYGFFLDFFSSPINSHDEYP